MQRASETHSSQQDAGVGAQREFISRLQRSKNYKALGQLGGISVVHGHCGWGWRGLDDVGTADDLFYESEAWEAACFESGLMTEVEDMPATLSDAMLAKLGMSES